MSVIYKIEELCRFHGTTITELEKVMGYSNGSLRRSTNQTLRSDRIQQIAEHFEVTPTYLINEMRHDICPVCAFLYNPLEKKDVIMHHQIHKNFIALKNKFGFLMNITQAASSRLYAKADLLDSSASKAKKAYSYELLLHCDFADYAFSQRYIVDIEYPDFIKNEIISKKYFDLVSTQILSEIMLKFDVHLNYDEKPFIEKIQDDAEFMANISNLWELPQEFRDDVYKAVRHAKRDLADREYFTTMYPTKRNPFI